MNIGIVKKGCVEQIKGIDYLLEEFLGKATWPNLSKQLFNLVEKDSKLHRHMYEISILKNALENCLYHCVIYLAPGDYHKFHSPTDWEIFYRRHFPGNLLSVNKRVVKKRKGIYNLNERVVYYGQWEYGFFSMTAVGATNVGSIKVYMDQVIII